MKLLTTNIDSEALENFRRIQKEFNINQPFLKGGFKFFEIVIAKAVTNFKYAHKLGFAPKDVVQTSVLGTGVLTWNFSKFDKTNLDITTTGPCTVRAFIGAYSEGDFNQ